MGLTLVAAPGGTPLHLDVRMSLSTVSGTWRDSTGQNGAWALSPGPPAGGGPRPPSRVLFPAGVSAGGAAVTNVGPPVLSTDAATKGYVDSGDAGGRAYANAVATAAVPISAITAGVRGGSPYVSGLGCQEGRGFNLVMDLPVPVGGSITGIIVRYVASVQSPRMTFRIAAIDENDLTPFDFTQILSFDSSVPSRGGFRNDSRVGFSAAPVSLTRRYLLFVDAPAPDYFTLCGATVLYSMP